MWKNCKCERWTMLTELTALVILSWMLFLVLQLLGHARLCCPMGYSRPGFPVPHCLLDFAWAHVHWVSDLAQPSHSLSLPSPFAFNLSQNQSLFQWVGSLHQVPKQSIRVSASATVLPMNIQCWVPLGLTGLVSLLSKGLSRVFSSTTIWKYQFFGTQLSLWSNSHIRMWLLEKP